LTILPLNSPVGIVDLCVGSTSVLFHLIFRAGDHVVVSGRIAADLAAADLVPLLETWQRSNVAHELSQRQAGAIDEISRTLHDRFFCTLADQLAQLGITQVVLIPDVLTRPLPLHLANVCAKNVEHIVAGILMKERPERPERFCEVFPVEYAPCLQAVAVTLPQTRPVSLQGVLSIADPASDLPGARATAAQVEESAAKAKVTCVTRLGEQATRAELLAHVHTASLIVIGSHGVFDSANPARSRLELYDGPWTLAEMIDQRPLSTSPVVVLSACEVGATTVTFDDLVASGIPGALVSAGAASVLATLWPVEDISTAYVIERFLLHLSWPGFRPSAALFRAIYDLRRLSKDDALSRCRAHMKRMDDDGSRDSLAAQYLMLQNLELFIEDHPGPHPFDHPQFWGGIVIFGSGWHASARAQLGSGPRRMESLAETVEQKLEMRRLLGKGRFREARAIIDRLLPVIDGVERAMMLEALACCVWGARLQGADASAAKEALGHLDEAARMLHAWSQDELLPIVAATRAKIERSLESHVQTRHD
jgi:CHAT domain-containing protein